MAAWRPDEHAAILARSAGARGLGGLRQVTLDDGPTRGQRLLQLRNAQGLEAEIALDRGFDIAALRYRGTNLGWLGPSDYPAAAAVEDDRGLGLLRTFEGFLVTCGLDHHGLPAIGPADHFHYPNRSLVEYPLHGRIGTIPAVLIARDIDLDSDVPMIRCTAVVRQAVVFGEVLELRRTIRMPLLGNSIAIDDIVTNRGYTPARHGILYHINVGYPLLDETTLVSGVESQTISGWASSPPRPDPDAVESFEIVRTLDARSAGVQVSNPALGDLSLTIRYDDRALPSMGLWQTNQSGLFALGLEPHTPLGPADRPYRKGSPDFLEPGATRHYHVSVEVQVS
ncbi:DUF4432 family protein [Sphingomonas sp.]|uniref:DUF4432 family protein n=1 Tax=Sphingomonas sp. TaxID=28214 RepID=UPI0031DE7D32